MFVNPKSGGNKGQDFLRVPQPFIVDLPHGRQASVRIYSLLDGESGNKEGFKVLKQVVSTCGYPVRTIVGGGDGTVMWADTEAAKHDIHTPSQLLYGIVPLGTGNDFSRVAGWGGRNPDKILDKDCRVLRNLVTRWCEAKPRGHDVWQVVRVEEADGKIKVVDKNKEESDFGDGTVSKITLPMINYFSIGQESKVGIEFDKHRTKSQTCNLFVYAYEGFCTEIQCCTAQHIGNLVRSMHHGTDDSGPVIFHQSGDDDEVSELRGNPESLMFLNVNSYAGGNAHFWQREVDVGIDPEPDPEDCDVDENPGDGRLEVVTLPNILDIPLDRLDHMAKRVFSGSPFYIEFFEPDEDDNGGALDVYCEVDGEFYHLVNPESVTITLNKTLQVLQKSETN